MKNILLIIAVLATGIITQINAQKYITKTGKIEIFSETPLFVIDGVNKKVASILNSANGDIVASTLIRSFRFEEALVEEHFNENYLEPNKFPKAIFKGKISNFEGVDLGKDGTYDITIVGKLTIHGQTRDIEETGKIIVENGKISASTQFNVSLKEYHIKIEKAYKKAIKDEIKLNVHFDYKFYR